MVLSSSLAGKGPALRVLPQRSPEPVSLMLPGAPKEGAIAELDNLIGLSEIKRLVFEIYAFAEVQRRRERAGLSSDKTVLHMVFRGNPGTGKTTVARIVAKLLFEAGLLSKGHMVEVERADLVGRYIGHTAQKTREMFRKALGGVLFIDEAYSLARGGEKDFGKECIDCIVKGMEDHANEVVVILAGYPGEMEVFLRSNPGLRSRFPLHLDFPDYGEDELVKIADLMLRERNYRVAPECRGLLGRIIGEANGRERIPSNARLVRNLLEKAIRKQAVRLVKEQAFSRRDLTLITQRDLLEASLA